MGQSIFPLDAVPDGQVGVQPRAVCFEVVWRQLEGIFLIVKLTKVRGSLLTVSDSRTRRGSWFFTKTRPNRLEARRGTCQP